MKRNGIVAANGRKRLCPHTEKLNQNLSSLPPKITPLKVPTRDKYQAGNLRVWKNVQEKPGKTSITLI